MALDGLLLRQLQKSIKTLLPAKINKIQQVSDTEILLTLRSRNHNHRLLISAHSVYNRINLTNKSYVTPEVPGNFNMVMRKHLDGGIILSMEQVGLDRILDTVIEVRNELGDIHILHMYIELMGKYANVILVDEDHKIIDALKRIPPYENSKRLILPQAQFVMPQAHTGKQDPYHHEQIDYDLPFTKQFHGFSPLFSNEMQYRIAHGETFDEVMEELKHSDQIYISEKDHQTYYHAIPLKHLEVPAAAYELMHGIDIVYYEKEEKVRIKQQTGDLIRTVHRELHKNQSKLPKLQATLDEAMNCDRYREYGDLLFAYQYQFTQKCDHAVLPSFETGEDISIPLDPKLDVKGNANKYYNKYHKGKRAQKIVREQIAQAESEARYFEMIEMQLEQATMQDAAEIRTELVKLGYMRNVQSRIRRKKKQELPHFETFAFPDGMVYVGKNNIQNDYLTWHFARKDDLWMHTKDFHGAHVIIRSDHITESLLRGSAMLAAWYSKGRESSSVPVNYCEIRQLKKIPGSKLGLVTMQSYKTIYIDPSKADVQELCDRYQQ